MNTDVKKKTNFREIFKFISTIISWTIFVLLVICACLLFYYFIAIRVYVAKGEGHEPAFSLYTIITPSMTPNINVYDVVVDTKVKKPEDIKINDLTHQYLVFVVAQLLTVLLQLTLIRTGNITIEQRVTTT